MKINNKVAFPAIFVIIIIAALALIFLTKTGFTLPGQSEDSWKVKIIDGNIYKVYSSTKKELIVSTTDIKGEMIQSFIAVELSPDRSKICFIGQSMVPQWLYYASSDGTGITKVGLGKNCVWSGSSKKIAYNNHTTDVSPVNVLVYDLAQAKTTNYTKSVQSENLFRAYTTPIWSSDDKTVTSEFSSLALDGTGTSKRGTSVIDLASGKVSDR
jgi:hypothetical protein